MSEINHENLSQVGVENAANVTIKQKPANKTGGGAKFATLLALVALGSCGYLAYAGIWGSYGMLNQMKINNMQNERFVKLQIINTRLENRINQLESQQLNLREEFHQVSPTQTSLIIYQLNSLISGANQSLILYHDYVAAIKLLNYAKQVLNSSDSPLFTQLKVSLATDLDNLQAQNNFDSTMLATELDNSYQLLNQLSIVAPIQADTSTSVNDSTWQKIVKNLKSSLFGLVKVVKSNPSAGAVLVPENEMVVRQHLQLDLMNAKQALLTRNQALWSGSILEARTMLQQYFVVDLTSQKLSVILEQLQKINFNGANANLDLTMQALIKLEQLNDGK